MSNFWINAQGQNTLKGVEGSLDNPPRLPFYLIEEFLREYREARAGLRELYPLLNEDERLRLDPLYSNTSVMRDRKYDQEFEDDFQTTMNDLRINLTNQHLPRRREPRPAVESSGLVVRLK